MLILTRRPGESIMIENSGTVTQEASEEKGESITLGLEKGLITITVLRVKGGQISLGIDAPPSISIYREEIYRKREQQSIDESQSEYAKHYDSSYSEEEDSYY